MNEVGMFVVKEPMVLASRLYISLYNVPPHEMIIEECKSRRVDFANWVMERVQRMNLSEDDYELLPYVPDVLEDVDRTTHRIPGDAMFTIDAAIRICNVIIKNKFDIRELRRLKSIASYFKSVQYAYDAMKNIAGNIYG